MNKPHVLPENRSELDVLRQQIEAQLPEGTSFDDILLPFLEAAKDPVKAESMDLIWRGSKAREFSLEGWRHWYWCWTKWEYPDAHLPMIEALIAAKKGGKAKMIQAWRGFGKTFDLLLFIAWLVGLFPLGSTGLVQINDTKAQKAGDAIADMIDKSLVWRAVFPNVVPDKETGWSSTKGYNVMDKNVVKDAAGYARWLERCFADHGAEASLMCAGAESGDIIGWHPSNGMYFDDLHDESNTRSSAEMQKLVDIFEGNIIPTWFSARGMPILACICTPWNSDVDVYHSMLQTGLFDLVKIPIFTPDPEGELFPPLEIKVKLTWPEAWPMGKVVMIYDANPSRFFQMYLLDDKAARKYAVYTWWGFEHEKIDLNWPITAGADPVYTSLNSDAPRPTSHFALCFAMQTPYGSAVIYDGILEQCSASQGMDYIIASQNKFPNYGFTWCENDAGNEVFIQMVQQNKGIRILDFKLSKIGKGKKEQRQYDFLEGLFRKGLVVVSNAKTLFLDCLRSYLIRYPHISEHAPEWDVADSVVAALYGMPEVRYRAVMTADDKRPKLPPRKKIDWNKAFQY